MTKTYTLELKFVLTDEQQEQVLEAARRVYAAGSPSTSYDGDIPRELSAEEFIEVPGSALLHLLEQNAVLEELDVERKRGLIYGPRLRGRQRRGRRTRLR